MNVVENIRINKLIKCVPLYKETHWYYNDTKPNNNEFEIKCKSVEPRKIENYLFVLFF